MRRKDMQRELYAIVLLLVCILVNTYYVAHTRAQTVTENVTVSAIVGGTPVTPPSSGGGGGIAIPKTSVRFSGEAYPGAKVIILKNGVQVMSTTAESSGLFDATLPEIYSSTTLYSLYARDMLGNQSLLINYPLAVRIGYLTYVSGIRFPPTITLDKVEVAHGDYLTVAGYALPMKELVIIIEDVQKKATQFTLISHANGLYNITLPLLGLSKGKYRAHIQYPNDARISKVIAFTIGNTNIKSIDVTLNIPGDCNTDGRINLTDFSVLAFWYKKANPPRCVDVNSDNIVNLTDFSVLAFYWTS